MPRYDAQHGRCAASSNYLHPARPSNAAQTAGRRLLRFQSGSRNVHQRRSCSQRAALQLQRPRAAKRKHPRVRDGFPANVKHTHEPARDSQRQGRPHVPQPRGSPRFDEEHSWWKRMPKSSPCKDHMAKRQLRRAHAERGVCVIKGRALQRRVCNRAAVAKRAHARAACHRRRRALRRHSKPRRPGPQPLANQT
eukprot:6628557-Prymnesium_polylepis.1